MKNKKIVFFSGAGISQESGIKTFRCPKEGIYKDLEVEKVVHASMLKHKPEIVYDFCNIFRNDILDKRPNEAHKLIARLEGSFDITVITTNIDSLHEDAGSTNVLHLHGELNKSRTFGNPANLYPLKGDLHVGDVDDNGDKLRPHVVLFEEMPYNVNESYDALEETDFLVIIGNSLSIGYTIPMLASVNPDAKVYYIDPTPSKDLEYYSLIPEYIKLSATKGMKKLYTKLLKTLD